MLIQEPYEILIEELTFTAKDPKLLVTFGALLQKQHSKNNFKVVTTPDATTLEYYQSIYTHCKQKFNISDGIKTFKKTLYQYIENRINNYLFRNYNISEVRHNLYESLIHHSCLNTQDFNSQTLETYFQELNFNIIQYCKENYLVKQKFSLSFELETEEGKGKRKQKLRTTSNTPKTTAKHLQTPEQRTSFKLPLSITPFLASLAQLQTPSSPLIRFLRIEDFQSPKSSIQQQKPILISTNLIDYLAENQSEETESEQETEDSENEKEMASTYIAKIPEFTEKDSETSPQEWLDKVSKAGDANGWNTARMLKAISYLLQGMAGEWFENLEALPEHWEAFKTAFLEQFTDNNTSITLRNWFQNIKQEPSESIMTYLGKFNKLLKRIHQLETNEYYSNAQILDQFIAGLKDKLIKKVCSYAPEDLATAIQQMKNYEMAIEEANRTKLVNLAIGETSSAAEKKIDQLTKKVENYFTNQQQQQPQRYQPSQKRNQNNFASFSNNQPQNCHYCRIPGHWKRDCRKLQQDQQNRSNQHYSPPQQSYYQLLPPAYYPPRLQYQTQPRPNYYHTQPSYLTIPEEQNFHHTALSEGRAAAQQQNPSYTFIIILPARIAENANLSDIFPFKFEANESLFLLSNAAANKQKAITAIYIEAEVEKKPICLILDSGSARSIITYQLMQQLKRNVDQPAQTIIVTADGIKKTPVGEIDNFPFTIDGITIPVKVLVMNAPQYQAFIRNDWLQKANANLIPATCGTFNKHSKKAPAFEFEPEEEKPIIKTFMALGSMSNWANETEQEHFTPHSEPETPG
ncbi:hypothetical protein G9A89_004776 [Geosiphon pyriformis]|nr:hypothetical protein G9A89_004776 [Geosiphon pyriformis]